MRLVLDTSVIVAAFRSKQGASQELLVLALDHQLTVVATPSLFCEYEAVLKRAEQISVHGHTRDQIDEFLLLFAGVVEQIRQPFRWRPQLPDAADEHVLEAAINGRADALVTFNTRDFARAGSRFGIRIVRPSVILNERLIHE